MLRDPLLFGDYRNALDEEEIRYYEDLLDYEAVYFLFQEVRLLTRYRERLRERERECERERRCERENVLGAGGLRIAILFLTFHISSRSLVYQQSF